MHSHSHPHALPRPHSLLPSSFLLLLPPSSLRISNTKRLQSSTFALSQNETKFPTQPYKNSNNSSQSLAHISNCKFPLARPLVSSSHPASTNSSTKLLNSMLLFAFLTLQPSYPALAASSDFSTIFGDIGDLSTGFASVRKISLSLFFFFNYNAFKKIIKINLNYRNGQWKKECINA